MCQFLDRNYIGGVVRRRAISWRNICDWLRWRADWASKALYGESFRKSEARICLRSQCWHTVCFTVTVNSSMKKSARWCSDHNVTWNDSNFFISGDVNTLSNCCRLLSDTSKLNAFINSIGGTALSIEFRKVNTINLMRIALENWVWREKSILLCSKSVRCCAVKRLDTVPPYHQEERWEGTAPQLSGWRGRDGQAKYGTYGYP